MWRVYGRKVTRITRGDLSVCPVLETSRDVLMSRQKSADAIVAGLTTLSEGLNTKRWTGAEVSMTTGVGGDRVEISGAMAKVSDRKSPEYACGVTRGTATKEASCPETQRLMESILSRENMQAAYQRVVSNKGAAGIDGMTVSELGGYLRHSWPASTDPKRCAKLKSPKLQGGSAPSGFPRSSTDLSSRPCISS